MQPTDLIPLVVVALATSVALVTDLWMFKIHDALTLPMMALGVVVSTCLGGWEGLAASLLGASLGFGLLVVPRAMGGVGAGDLKLLIAVGAWLGPYLTSQVFVASAVFQVLYAVGLILWRRGVLGLAVELIATKDRLLAPGSWGRSTSNIEAEVRRPDRRARLVPFAAMTCLGYFATMAWWGSDLDRVWPPDGRVSTVSTASTADLGLAREGVNR